MRGEHDARGDQHRVTGQEQPDDDRAFEKDESEHHRHDHSGACRDQRIETADGERSTVLRSRDQCVSFVEAASSPRLGRRGRCVAALEHLLTDRDDPGRIETNTISRKMTSTWSRMNATAEQVAQDRDAARPTGCRRRCCTSGTAVASSATHRPRTGMNVRTIGTNLARMMVIGPCFSKKSCDSST